MELHITEISETVKTQIWGCFLMGSFLLGFFFFFPLQTVSLMNLAFELVKTVEVLSATSWLSIALDRKLCFKIKTLPKSSAWNYT